MRSKFDRSFWYMDDLKLFAKGRERVEGELEIVRHFSEISQMKFVLDKCAAVHIRKVKLTESKGITLADGSRISELGPGNTYRCLGIQQSYEIRQKNIKGKDEKELVRSVSKIMKFQLNARNKVLAINIWGMPIIRYIAGIMEWLDNTRRSGPS